MDRTRAALLILAAVLGLAVPVALGAAPVAVSPGQRIDMKVLLLSADGKEPGFDAWKTELQREGVPYTAIVADTAPDITESQLFTGDHALYQAVILASGDLKRNVANANGTVSFLSALTDAEWAALAKFERTFGIRQLSDYTAPSPAHGLNDVGGAVQDGAAATLTAAGKLAFPYLKGTVGIANDAATVDEAFGYRATPVNAADWQTLLSAPDGTSYLGIYTHPDDGREEMVMTVASNQFQNHNQLLRHGMLNWVTRGVYLGYERNYLELDVDDVFLPDDKWNPTTNVTEYGTNTAIRMTAADANNAVAWQNRTGLKLNMVYNMGGTDTATTNPDPLLTAFKGLKNNFRWINHTYEHPNLDCQTAPYIAAQLTTNQTRFNALLGPVAAGLNDPSEAVTGEHSGIANTRPGNPGTIDPPSLDSLAAATGTLAAGSYDYGVSATTAAGESAASIASITLPAGGGATLTWPSVCHATTYKVYRRAGTTGAWSLLQTLQPLSPAFTDSGAVDVTYADNGAAGGAGTPPTANGAAIAPYPQNPSFIGAMTTAGIRTIASDASKDYPNPPTATTVAESAAGNFPKGAIFQDGPTWSVPRYPSNIYYNVASRADQLDEYNWIYTAPGGTNGGGCVPIANVTTCNTAPVTWQQYLDSETRIMFGHLTGNDPRPHYFHQTNLAQSDLTKAPTDTTTGGILYGVMDTLLARYDAAYDRAKAPLRQLTPTQIAATLVQQRDWAAAQNNVQAWLQDGVVHVKNAGTAAVSLPLTGTTVGEAYGGQRSGWTALNPGAQLDVSPADPAATAAPAVTGTARVGEKLTASGGAWNGTAPVAFRYQWQRCAGATCTNIPAATGSTYTLAGADENARMRVVVMAGNWVSSVSQAPSAMTAAVDKAPAQTRRNGDSSSGSSKPAGSARLSLTKLKLSPRTFPVAHNRAQPGTRLDGTRISWRVNKAAKVKLQFQRRAGKRWVRIGTITRSAKAGTGVVRFRGRFGSKLLVPKQYRVVVTASAGKERTAAKRVSFRVVKG